PSTGGYEPPAGTGGYEPPAPGGYGAPAPGGYGAAASGGYSQPPSGGGFPEPPGPGSFPPAAGYGQQPAYDPNAYPGAGAGYPVAPVPGSAAGGLAEWPKRALGGLVDYVAAGVVIAIVVNILSNISSGLGTVVNIILSVGWMCYLGYKSGTTGVTFGRSIAKTKLVAESGQPLGVTNGIIRQFAHIIDSIICYIGWLFPLWDAKKQTLADKIMKTVVIDNSADPQASTYNWQ
ncbi:RDD family protein, partial [Propionicimonas sp.]|uniref:RDD family protein n=1 Tax=Propionicimonas sp. TaxID=1955623 RepID=UPI0039E24AC0